MKKFITSDKFINSRFALKTGSMLFLLFFAFFSLAAPLVAQIGSALFILGGMLLAPFVHQESLAQDELPPPPEQACYANAWEANDLPDAALKPVSKRLQQKKHVIDRNPVADQALQCRTLQIPVRTSPRVALLNIALPQKLHHTLACPVRAGPDQILFTV